MSLVLNLESFDEASTVGDRFSSHHVQTYEEGFSDGEAAAEARLSSEHLRFRAEVVDSLSDSAFGYQEAQLNLLVGMQSYINSILNLVLPATLSHGLHMQLRDILVRSLKIDVGRPLTVLLPSNQMAAFSDVISDLNLSDVTLVIDDNLTDHAAFTSSAAGETALDFDEILDAIKDHTAILQAPSVGVS